MMLAMRKDSKETSLIQELKLVPGLKVKTSEPLARYTSIKIGGPADYFLEAENEPALAKLLPVLKRHGTAFCLLGNGSNVLISDLGIRGSVIHLAGDFKRAEWIEEGETVSGNIGAASPVAQLVRQAARRGYGGLEFAEGIPGSMGGALVMNAGAYGSEFEKVVDTVEGLTEEGQSVRFSRAEMIFSYRDSHLPRGLVVTRVHLRLRKEGIAQVSSRMLELVTKRKSSQPSGFPNSGSMFRNPPGDFAGRLIEAAGLKGRTIGQAQISERHANFIVNRGGAQATEVRELMELAGSEVNRQFGIRLEPEVRFLGEWKSN
jgi:UDP-N-acetylmuramate dehydrogenase